MIDHLLARVGNVAARAILRAALPSMPLAYLKRTLRALEPTQAPLRDYQQAIIDGIRVSNGVFYVRMHSENVVGGQ